MYSKERSIPEYCSFHSPWFCSQHTPPWSHTDRTALNHLPLDVLSSRKPLWSVSWPFPVSMLPLSICRCGFPRAYCLWEYPLSWRQPPSVEPFLAAKTSVLSVPLPSMHFTADPVLLCDAAADWTFLKGEVQLQASLPSQYVPYSPCELSKAC